MVGARFGGSMNQGSAYVFVADTPPTITLKDPISLWPPNYNYRAVIMSQMVQSATGPATLTILTLCPRLAPTA